MKSNNDLQLPSSLDAERTILGAILLDNLRCDETASLTIEDFYLDSHQRIFKSMRKLDLQFLPIDIITLSDELQRHRDLDSVGGVAYISSLIDGVPHQQNIESYVKIVKDKSLLRKLINSANKAITSALEQMEDVKDCAAIIQKSITEITTEATRNNAVMIGSYANDVFAELRTHRASERTIIGFETCLPALDVALGGFRNGENIVVASWTGGGKTAYALQVACKAASQDVPVGIFSVEMRKEELLLRACSGETRIDHLKLRNPRDLDDEEVDKVANAMSEMKRWPLWIDDTGNLSINDLCARGRMLASKGCKLLVIDYLQLIRASGKDTREKVNEISQGIRELAKHTRVPILNISQLSRPKEGTRRRPTIYDLKESGNIEQDAHVVLLLHRPVVSDGSFTHEDEVIVGKQRSGPTGCEAAYFDGATMRWFPRQIISKKDTAEIADGKSLAEGTQA